MRKLPNERLDKGCRQGLCQFHCNIVTVCNINCSIATCVLDVCKHVCTSRMICIINDAQQPAGKASIPSLPTGTLLSVFTQKDKKKKAKREKRQRIHVQAGNTPSKLIDV